MLRSCTQAHLQCTHAHIHIHEIQARSNGDYENEFRWRKRIIDDAV